MTRRILEPRRLGTGLALGVIVVLLAWILGAFRRGLIKPGRHPVPQATVAGLATELVLRQAVPAVMELPGTVQAEQLATVSARVTANILQMRAAAGQRVAAGEPLVVLDDRDLRHRLEQAKDAAAAAEAALAMARSDYRRDKAVYDVQGLSAYEFEHTETALRTAEANQHRLREAVHEAEVDLSYAEVRSPFAGVVVDKQANLGDLAVPGKPLLTLYQAGRLWLEASIPEDFAAKVRPGDRLRFRIDALDRELSGPVAEVVPAADPGSRGVLARVRLPGACGAWPGMYGRLMLATASEERLTVPATAVVRAGQLTLVDVVRDGQAEHRSVQLGRYLGDRYEVLSGLAQGETVVVGNGR